jgi:uncharacterized membrane protein YphA (DoxX/SURF4 family)
MLILRAIVGLLFIISGIGKLLDFRNTILSIANFKILPSSWIPISACALILLEIWLGLMLLLGVRLRAYSTCAIILLSIFSIAVFSRLVRGDSFDCGCFGLLYKSNIGIALLFRNFMLSILALIIGFYDTHLYTVARFRTHS